MKRLLDFAEKAFLAIGRVFEIVGIVGMIGIMLMLVIQTVLKWFSVSLLWSDEMVSVMNIWLVFSAAAVVSRERKHIQVNFITDMLPDFVQTMLEIIITLLCLGTCVQVLRGGAAFLRQTGNITTNILRLPMVAIYSAPLLGVGFMGLLLVFDLLRQIWGVFTGRRRGQS